MSESWADAFFQGPWLRVQRGAFTDEQTAEYTEQVMALAGLSAGDHVLDCPCGEGRVSRELVRRGLSVVGVDLTEALLQTARERTAEAGLSVAYRQGDMRFLEDLGLEASFDAVLNCWGSFGYFSDIENRSVIQSWASVLRPGGRLFIDVPGTETIFARYFPRAWFEVDGVVVLEDRAYDWRTCRMDTTWTFVHEGQKVSRSSSIRIHTGREMVAMLQAAGFERVDIYGNFDGSDYKIDARRQLVVGTLPG